MRSLIRLAVMLLSAAVLMTGCAPLVSDDEMPLSIYATFYPIYALTEAVVRGIPDLELHCLVEPQDGCLRAYELSDRDVKLLATSDAIVLGGRGLESFESTLFGWGEQGPAITAVLYNLDLYSDGAAHSGEETSAHFSGANPHLYMSLDGAEEMIRSISALLSTLCPGLADRFGAHADDAVMELKALCDEDRALLADCAGRGVALMNEALIYVAKDHGLKVEEKIIRESGEMLYASDLGDCLTALQKSGAQVVLIERQAPEALTDALTDAGFAVAPLDVLSTHREGQGFDVYLEAMRSNARAIRAAFDAVDRREGEP